LEARAECVHRKKVLEQESGKSRLTLNLIFVDVVPAIALKIEITPLASRCMESTLCAESCRAWVNSFILLLLYYISISSSVFFCDYSVVSESHETSACRIGAELHRVENGVDRVCPLDGRSCLFGSSKELKGCSP
jgi:hypothetical protein